MKGSLMPLSRAKTRRSQ